MAIVSSHILDSVTGRSAAGIRCQLLKIGPGGQRQAVFDVIADAEGRIHETIPSADTDSGGEYELVLHAADYFQAESATVPVVVLRFLVHDVERRYHLPVMLSPHSYSTWWST